ncbi:uncharacterized protein DMENIID0001_080660 [Sergentomyia squamirostris]
MSSSIEEEFRKFFLKLELENLPPNVKRKIYKPLLNHLRWKVVKKYILIIGSLTILWTFCQISVIQWNLSAVVRIFMIKMLPLWNWTTMYGTKCLIEYRGSDLAPNANEAKADLNSGVDCSVCENLDSITRTWKTDYSYLEDFIERGLPVVLMNAHEGWPEDNFTEHLLTLEPLLESIPCLMISNLIVRQTSVQELIERVQRVEESSWFVHFRNCEFPAVKVTRLIAPRPHFFPPHLEPAYSSWIIMSHRYDHPEFKELILQGIILVRQMQGRGKFQLSGRGECLKECGEYIVELTEGDALLFTTDLWDFAYLTTESSTKSVTFITETHFPE